MPQICVIILSSTASIIVNFSKSILLLILVFVSATSVVAQRHFYFDEPFKQPVKIPAGVLGLVRQEIERAHMCRLTRTTKVSSWFSASRIDLSPRHTSIILKSVEGCLNGVDNDWFWIFLKTERGYRLVLTGGSISLDVLKNQSRGLRDIETNAATARTNYTNIYRFDGSVYKMSTCTEASPVGAKPEVVPCRTQ
jgi:hypothetical protein